jgi:hypothetical protein
MWTSGEDFDTAGAEKTAKPKLRYYRKLQSFDLGSLRPGRRRKRLTVLVPHRFPLVARTPVTRARTIPFKQDTLWQLKK